MGQSEKSTHFTALQKHLNGLPVGRISDVESVERFLFKCWHEFDGGEETKMDGHKLLHRTEEMQWNPPCLEFDMERHGGTVAGSVYAEIQSWTVDLSKMTATVARTGRRQVEAKDKPLKTKPLAEVVAKLILDKTKDPHLLWKHDDKVRLNIEKMIPATNQQTTGARRKRFRTDLLEILHPHGWKMTTMNTFERK